MEEIMEMVAGILLTLFWTWGGVSMIQSKYCQTYGKYEVRFKMDPGYGVAGVILLWACNNQWPPEIDFYEDGGGTMFNDGNRSKGSATLHWSSQNLQNTTWVNADFTQWHTIGVEWTPGNLVYTLDGNVWSTVQSNGVPSLPMGLGLQTQTGTNCAQNWWNACPDSSTPAQVNMYIDWVAVYSYSP
eukprot:TRINITY_DN1308_c0_g2_i4.p1 TRINITY_DN1308_c0_g2~~TRINITY_DN1308_c0_g2_i4.p1  ORF type:complete len:186 (+),score=35.95 TRINITY_DN1308_c0_g2_i4:167-724(+)